MLAFTVKLGVRKLYEKYGLFDNPFKLEHNHKIVGKSQNQTFDSLLQFFAFKAAYKQRTGDRFISVLKGDYGTGKSFFLFKLTESTMKRDSRYEKLVKDDIKLAISSFPILTEDKKLPTKIMLHLYRRIVENLEGNGERFFAGLYKSLEDKANSNGVEIKELISELSPDFRKVILSLSDDCQEQYIAWKWISAKRLTQKELRALRVKYHINSGELAEKYLFQILKLLNIIEYGLLIVLIDELEEVLTTVNEKQFWRAFLVIKEIFEQYVSMKYSHLRPMTPIGFVGGMTPEAWESIEKGAEDEQAIQAVRSRISENVFEFGRFDEEDTSKFIEVLLKKTRLKKYKGDSLFPFEEETIRSIQEASYGNPREIINICQRLLQEAYKKDLDRIALKTVNEYLLRVGGGPSFEESLGDVEEDLLEEEEKI